MSGINVLLLAANPEARNLRLAAEQREIQERVEQAERRLQKSSSSASLPISFTALGAVRVRDLVTGLRLQAPQVMHFSGHGAAGGEIILEDNAGRRLPLPPDVLANILAEFRASLRLVFLNACYSQGQAAGVVCAVDCFIGMTRTIEDQAALAFAGLFYQLLALGSSVGQAFRLAREELAVLGDGADARDVPCLITRSGVDANQVFLLQPRQEEPLLRPPRRR